MSSTKVNQSTHNLEFLRRFCSEATEIIRCHYVDDPGDWVIYFLAGDHPRIAYIERIGDTITWRLHEEYIP